MGGDGVGTGYEVGLLRGDTEAVSIPVVASGGLGQPTRLAELLDETDASAAAVAQALHWGRLTIGSLREVLSRKGCFVRPLPEHEGARNTEVQS
jgi:cyclase